MLEVSGLHVADAAEVWTQAGFTVDDDGSCRVGGVRILLTGPAAGRGVVGWSLRGLPGGPAFELDGVPTEPSAAPPVEPGRHLNGVISLDHLVLLSPDLARTVAAFAALGETPRRERDGELGGRPMRQIFYRFGEVIVEVVGAPDQASDGPSTLWGITYVVDDVEATAAFFGANTTPVKDAVQPGRRITTLRNRELGLSVRTALISPPVRH